MRRGYPIILLSVLVVTAMMAVPSAYTEEGPEDIYGSVVLMMIDKDSGTAERMCLSMLKRDPRDARAMVLLGELYWSAGEKGRAIKMFRKALKYDRALPDASFFLGKAYFSERKPEKGRECFDRYLDLTKDMVVGEDIWTYLHLSRLNAIAYIYYNHRYYDDSTDIYDRIISLWPDDQKAHYNRGVLYYNGYKKVSEAYKEMKKVIDIDPASDMARKAEFYIDYMRRNPDPRMAGDLSFMYE
ncbi:MAG: tetratricopeptide repeat protein [Candidatus Omnitrophica bacterium]|nr:tetratricopeptide repeat protein [Candidatus Omnitrophota bacterium]